MDICYKICQKEKVIALQRKKTGKQNMSQNLSENKAKLMKKQKELIGYTSEQAKERKEGWIAKALIKKQGKIAKPPYRVWLSLDNSGRVGMNRLSFGSLCSYLSQLLHKRVSL